MVSSKRKSPPLFGESLSKHDGQAGAGGGSFVRRFGVRARMGDVDGWTPSDHLGRDERDNVRPTPIDFPFPSTSLSVYFYPKTAEIKKMLPTL